MFEKEAEERARKLEENQTLGIYDNEEEYARDRGWNDGEVAGYEEGFQDGAEFGYNKAKEEDKWHYPSKGEYPKVETWVIGFYYGKDNWHKIFYRADGHWWGEGQLCQPPYVWKEIVPPKEIK